MTTTEGEVRLKGLLKWRTIGRSPRSDTSRFYKDPSVGETSLGGFVSKGQLQHML